MASPERIVIGRTEYGVERLDPGASGSAAVRLHKESGDHYDVLRADELVSCSCADFVFRVEGRSDGMCKHGAAAVRAGLL
jgi:predicted nucleic acid-binding Zn finger protein